MKKISLLVVLLLLFSFGTTVLAQENDLPDPGMTPDSPFYFFKTWKEKVQLFFTFGAEKKAKQYLHLAEVRLAEYKKMVEKEKTEIAQKTKEKYEKQLGKALEKAEGVKEKGKNIEVLVNRIKERTLRHQEVLTRVLEKAPEQARKGLQNAIEMSKKGHLRAIEAISKIKEEQANNGEDEEDEDGEEEEGEEPEEESKGQGKAKGKNKNNE